MGAILIDGELQIQLDSMARILHKHPQEIASEAIHAYLTQLGEQKLDREIAAFEAMYTDLRARYLNQFVAIHDGAVVGVAPEFEPLCLQIQARFGNIVVLIRRVTDQMDDELYFRSPRLAGQY